MKLPESPISELNLFSSYIHFQLANKEVFWLSPLSKIWSIQYLIFWILWLLLDSSARLGCLVCTTERLLSNYKKRGIGHSNRDHTNSKRGPLEGFTTKLPKAELDRLLNKLLKAPSLGGDCVIPITVLYWANFRF